jgi:hypothetical protein
MNLLDASDLGITHELESPDQRRFGTPGNFERVGEVVVVTVRAEDEISLDVRGLDLRPGIVVEERVDDDAGAVVRRKGKRRVP